MNTAKVVMAAAALVLSASRAFAQANVAGDWDMTIQTMQGTNTVRVTFKQDGEKISGIFRSRLGEVPFEGGSMLGNDLKFGLTIPIQGQSFEITMTGKVEGATIEGKAQFGGLGEGDWSAKRVETTSEPTPAASVTAAPAGLATGLISGTWDITVKTQMGDVPASAELTESAGKISGTVTGPTGAVDVSGTFDGTALKLAFVAKTPQGDISVSLTGELNGDEIVNGKADIGGMGQGEWSAKRKQQ